MKAHLPAMTEGMAALDIGCCYGYFSINLAMEGYSTLGVDLSPRSVRIANQAKNAAKVERCSFVDLTVDPKSIALLPSVNVVLCLAVWHHWVKHYGIDSATDMLRTIWNATVNVLFFESGEDEDRSEFDLPFEEGNAREWLATYLEDVCADGDVTAVGVFPAGAYAKYSETGATRALFMVARRQAS